MHLIRVSIRQHKGKSESFGIAVDDSRHWPGSELHQRGDAVFHLGDPDALKLDPKMADAYVDLAEIYLWKGDREKAISLLNQAKGMNTSNRVRETFEKMLLRAKGR